MTFYHKYFRKLDYIINKHINDIYLYKYNYNNTNVNNIHWGQVKLFYSEVEALVKISKTHNLKDLLILYVGAASGDHLHFILRMFPEINLLLYDPREFNKDLYNDKRVIIKSGEKGWFNDDKIDEVKKIAGSRKIFYITDIRREVNEKMILEDLIIQQRWGIHMDAEFMLFKFRFPFFNESEYDLLNYKMDDIAKYINIDLSNKTKDSMLYLDGDIYIQLYPKIHSTETRLFVEKKDGYKLKYYNINTYEKSLVYYNNYYRNITYEYMNSSIMKNHILGFDDKYDSIGEYYIIYNYFKFYKKEEEELDIFIIKLLSDITNFFCKLTMNNKFTKQISRNATFLLKINDYFTKFNKYELANIINYIKDLYFIIDVLPYVYKKQYLEVEKSKINDTKHIYYFEKCSNKYIKLKNGNLEITQKFYDLINNINRKII